VWRQPNKARPEIAKKVGLRILVKWSYKMPPKANQVMVLAKLIPHRWGQPSVVRPEADQGLVAALPEAATSWSRNAGW